MFVLHNGRPRLTRRAAIDHSGVWERFDQVLAILISSGLALVCSLFGTRVAIGWFTRHGFGFAEGVLLCSWHHHRAHDDDTYGMNRLPNGDDRFNRRT
jgi:hypothetical protein